MKNGDFSDFTYKSDSAKGSISQKCMDLHSRNPLIINRKSKSVIVINNNEWTGNCIICIDANCQYYESMALVGEDEICEQSFCALRELVNPVEL
jgi:hypothetical protein